MYYNKKYKRTGGLFEGKYKAQHLDTDKYLKYIFSYIHLNPVKLIDQNWKEKGLKKVGLTIEHLKNYKYSSYLDYLETKRVQNLILDINKFPNYFSNNDIFGKEIFDWLSYKFS